MKVYVATIQVVIRNCDTQDQACDEVSEMMNSHYPDILDWGYVRFHGQYLYPTELYLPDGYDSYGEGDFLK